jgi:Tfp pilus assembly protein PilE
MNNTTQSNPRSKNDQGLTLIQLMIVIAAIGIVGSMAFRALGQHGL